ncbi:hypothetical protein [Phytoactinopolyspora endophytica]|uniref:hypothetical protein n=1 Tax=Phytoactinopolyspora endophytica TaxID=1642495 RepID=UPI00101D5AF3|nr:hypothetical protein [Phytoactinopolyspora endophytica]
MAKIHPPGQPHDVRIENSAGELVTHTDLGEQERPKDALHRLRLRPFGPTYAVDDGFVTAVEPLVEDVLTGDVTVGVDTFHRRVMLSLDDTRYACHDTSHARRIASAVHDAARRADQITIGADDSDGDRHG